MRLAIGASRGRLVRQLLTEGAVLVAAGATLGLLVSRWGVSTLVRFFAGGQQRIVLEPHFDVRVLTFTAAVAALTGLLFSIVPALQATRVDAAKPDDTNRTSTAKPRARLGQALVVVQVTLSLVLLSGAALFIRTLQNLNSVEAGFSRHGVMTMRVEAPLPPFDAARNAVTEHAQLAHMWQELLDRLSVLPAVTSVGFSTMSPLSRRDRGVLIDVPGEPQKTERDRSIHLNHVTPGYFDTFGIRLIEGRRFTPGDRPSSLRVAILNKTAVRLYFGQASPIGRLVTFPGQRIPDPYRIVGVVEDTPVRQSASRARSDGLSADRTVRRSAWQRHRRRPRGDRASRSSRQRTRRGGAKRARECRDQRDHARTADRRFDAAGAAGGDARERVRRAGARPCLHRCLRRPVVRGPAPYKRNWHPPRHWGPSRIR